MKNINITRFSLRVYVTFQHIKKLTTSLTGYWQPLLPYGYSYKASCAKQGQVVCNFGHLGTLTLTSECQSARMSNIANDSLTRSGTGCFIAVPIWQQWASKG